MSKVEEFPLAARAATEYEALIAAGPSALQAIPAAVCLCDHEGWLISYNSEAVEVWGRTPSIRAKERFCGSHHLFRSDGSALTHDASPVAETIRSGADTRNAELVIERPDGSRRTVLANVRALKDHRGRLQGAINCFQDITAHHAVERAVEQELRSRNQDLEDFFENGAIGMHIVSGEGIILRANKAELELLGYSQDEYVGRHIAEFHADAVGIGEILHRLASGEKLERHPARMRAKDGSVKHVLITSSSRFEQGRIVNTRCFMMDVTEQHAAEVARGESEKCIRESEQHMRELLEALPAAVYTTDAAGRITFYNKAAVEMAGHTPVPGQEWCVTWRLYTTEGARLPHDECPMAIALKEDRAVRGAEAVAERPDGTRVPFIPYPTPLHDSNGKLVGAINMLVDISDRKQAESRQKVLIDELNHRVKNTLATVQSLAMQTVRHADGLQDFMGKFQARLLAVAQAHDLLTRRHWENAPLESLATEVLAPLAGPAHARVTIEGPSFDLSPRAALSLTMALSELATNAVKYGALSAEHGTVSVRWDLRQQQDKTMLNIDWREQGGPPVSPPTRRGFGMRLMERCVESDLRGDFDLAFEPTGVCCGITVPVSSCSAHA
jgi:PAS domain S-box-containing protein